MVYGVFAVQMGFGPVPPKFSLIDKFEVDSDDEAKTTFRKKYEGGAEWRWMVLTLVRKDDEAVIDRN